jgi:hypothetical protein
MKKRADSWQLAVGSKQIVVLFLLLTAHCLFSSQAQAQDVVDKMVATVNGGMCGDSARSKQSCLITYSDLLWQLALQPNTPLENPSSENLNRALNLSISQRLILQEAEKLPTIAPSDAEIKVERDELARQFPSPSDFLQRASSVGLSGEQLTEILRQRVAIKKYLDFRFRSFTVVTEKEVTDYYHDVWIPRLRRQQPGRLVPELKEVYKTVETELTESKIESETDEFLDGARERAEITIINPV